VWQQNRISVGQCRLRESQDCNAQLQAQSIHSASNRPSTRTLRSASESRLESAQTTRSASSCPFIRVRRFADATTSFDGGGGSRISGIWSSAGSLHARMRRSGRLRCCWDSDPRSIVPRPPTPTRGPGKHLASRSPGLGAPTPRNSESHPSFARRIGPLPSVGGSPFRSSHHCSMVQIGYTAIPFKIPKYSFICEYVPLLISGTMSTW
jgi:hypothetical protein